MNFKCAARADLVLIKRGLKRSAAASYRAARVKSIQSQGEV